jgi:hypothetical protein
MMDALMLIKNSRMSIDKEFRIDIELFYLFRLLFGFRFSST